MSSGNYGHVTSRETAFAAFRDAFLEGIPAGAPRDNAIKEMEKLGSTKITAKIMNTAFETFHMQGGSRMGLDGIGETLDQLKTNIKGLRQQGSEKAVDSAIAIIESMHQEVSQPKPKPVAPPRGSVGTPDQLYHHPAISLLDKWFKDHPDHDSIEFFEAGTEIFVIARVKDGVAVQSAFDYQNKTKDENGRYKGTYLAMGPDGHLAFQRKGERYIFPKSDLDDVETHLKSRYNSGVQVDQSKGPAAALADAPASPSQPQLSKADAEALVQKATAETKEMENNYNATPYDAQLEAHRNAQNFLKEDLGKVGGDYQVVTPTLREVHTIKFWTDDEIENETHIVNTLNQNVFSMEITRGVARTIKEASEKTDVVTAVVAASQLNGAESQLRTLVSPGIVRFAYEADGTQGPAAQLTNSDEILELINLGAHRGVNYAIHILSEETKTAVQGGYLTPTSKEQAARLTEELKVKGARIRVPYVGAVPENAGTNKVYQVFVSAAAFGRYDLGGQTEEQKREIQYLVALHSYRAQFEAALKLNRDTGKPVELKAVGMGLGMFGNEPHIIAQAFYDAAIEYERALENAKVKVKFQVFQRNDQTPPEEKASAVVKMLKLN